MHDSNIPSAPVAIGVGIDTARYGHRVTFLRSDRQPAAPPLDVPESRAGYRQLAQVFERLQQREGDVHFFIRLDVAGAYAANLQRFLQELPGRKTISVGDPQRNKNYRCVHFPKRKSDAADSAAVARFAVVESPAATPATPAAFVALREVASQLQSQVRQTTRRVNQLHNLLSRVFPELATLVRDVSRAWVLRLLAKYPTPRQLARAQAASLRDIPYLRPAQAQALHTAARESVGSLQGEVAAELVRHAVEQVRASLAAEKRLEKLLQQAYQALPDSPHHHVRTIPGIGAATAAVLVAKIVSIDRFDTPGRLVGYFGVFPEENRSGFDRHGRPIPAGAMRMSPQGNDLVRRYLWNAACSAIRFNPAVRALYARLRARGRRGDVALGHCMRKLLHLVFAVWKSDRAFDPDHYPWGNPLARQGAPLPPADKKTTTAAGHTREVVPPRKVVTAANPSVDSTASGINPPTAARRGRRRVDFASLRQQVSMEQALRELGVWTRLRGRGPQRRGPCPVHGADAKDHRSFSVHLRKNVFQCFHPDCAAQGNVLDLWAAVHRLPLREAALHLANAFHLPLPNREEEPVASAHC